MDLSKTVPLYGFGFHPYPDWLEEVAKIAKQEPWGKNYKVLELYLRANFEIAKSQSKVFEDVENNLAFWRAGSLVNITSDPIWLLYRKNKRGFPVWQFDRAVTGEAPSGQNGNALSLKYEPPDFNKDWLIHFNQWNITHIMGDSKNQQRLKKVFCETLGEKFNDHLIFRAIYGEIQLKRKEEVVIPQWYHNDYQFLMPLFLTQSSRVELTAVLQPDPPLKRYIVKTLLLPWYAYAYSRALVRSRASYADWMMLTEEDLNKAAPEEEEG
jgi:hypothetical protein